MILQKALKFKKQLVLKIQKTVTDLTKNNSYEEGTVVAKDSKEALALWNTQINELVDLKVKMYKANLPIIDKIFRLTELKDQLSKLKSVSTQEGLVRVYGSPTPTTYKTCITQQEKDAIMEEIEIEIEIIQDELDNFNVSTEI